jgi:hypothetical protein
MGVPIVGEFAVVANSLFFGYFAFLMIAKPASMLKAVDYDDAHVESMKEGPLWPTFVSVCRYLGAASCGAAPLNSPSSSAFAVAFAILACSCSM